MALRAFMGPEGQRAVVEEGSETHKALLAAGYVDANEEAPAPLSPQATPKTYDEMTVIELQGELVALRVDVPPKTSRARMIEIIKSTTAKLAAEAKVRLSAEQAKARP